ncbi:uncharacterized protein LOC125952017 [Anopheles darlingi]|nr:uncharacterized protein LOC125952017 [Anopheles darlingi]
MSSAEVWSEDENPEHEQPEELSQPFCQARLEMQDIICEDNVRYVCMKNSDENNGGNHNSNSGNNSSFSACSTSNGNGLPMDKDEKRMRREIANSNERRRMQSINAGFQSLRQMLPHHEGEKLSKAAILQQTAEYIYSLEQEKTRLLSQNCQLKRLLDQQDHNGSPEGGAPPISMKSTVSNSTIVPVNETGLSNVVTGVATTAIGNPLVATVSKKRAMDSIPVSDSSDEGLGSMSPEPISLRSNGAGTAQHGSTPTSTTAVASTNIHTTTNSTNNGRLSTTVNFSVKDFLELKHQLDVERRQKTIVEDKLRTLERQLYPNHIQYQESSDSTLSKEPQSATGTSEDANISIIHKAQTGGGGNKTPRTVSVPISELEASGTQVLSLESSSTGLKRQIVVCGGNTDRSEDVTCKQILIPMKEEKVFIKRSRSRSPTIETVVTLPPKKHRYPSILEAAIKAEPKVEVERINSPSSIVVNEEHMMVSTAGGHLVGAGTKLTSIQQPPARLNTCRHNLETIVEAIRHLEGDAFDAVAPAQQQHTHSQTVQPSQPQPLPTVVSTASPPIPQQSLQHRPMQEVPLALTTNSKQQQQTMLQPKLDREHRQNQLEPYLKFRTTAANSNSNSVLTSSNTASTTIATAPNGSNNILNSSNTTIVAVASSSSSSNSVAVTASATNSIAGNSCQGSATTSKVGNAASNAPISLPAQQKIHLSQTTAAQILQQQQQCRPGVIVVKQNT